jgi:hypothetical protein
VPPVTAILAHRLRLEAGQFSAEAFNLGILRHVTLSHSSQEVSDCRHSRASRRTHRSNPRCASSAAATPHAANAAALPIAPPGSQLLDAYDRPPVDRPTAPAQKNVDEISSTFFCVLLSAGTHT